MTYRVGPDKTPLFLVVLTSFSCQICCFFSRSGRSSEQTSLYTLQKGFVPTWLCPIKNIGGRLRRNLLDGMRAP